MVLRSHRRYIARGIDQQVNRIDCSLRKERQPGHRPSSCVVRVPRFCMLSHGSLSCANSVFASKSRTHAMTDRFPTPVAAKNSGLQKCLTGIKGFDEITEGGIPRNRITLLSGLSGHLKSGH